MPPRELRMSLLWLSVSIVHMSQYEQLSGHSKDQNRTAWDTVDLEFSQDRCSLPARFFLLFLKLELQVLV
jgi:hypothetical protein